jgi:Uma2 family endonuclease
MATNPKTYLTPEQYLEIERKAEFKSEYYQGEMFAMGGARWTHNRLVANLIASLHQQLHAGPCQTLPSDMRVQVDATGLYAYPDVIVVCGEPKFLDENRDTLLNPRLIVEVLSPSTEFYDRVRKFELYRSVESVSEYLLVSSVRVSTDLYTRQPDDRWLLSTATRIEDSFELQSVGARLVLSDLYEKVDLAAPPAPAV